MQDTFQVLHHVPVPESDHSIPIISDFRASSVICLNRHRVLPAIHLDCQPRGRTGKIHNMPANGMLATKPVRAFQLSKRSP
jgi:hypothetical protein